MGFESSDLTGVANLALRALQHQARQTDAAASSTVASPAPTQTDGNSGNTNNGGGSGSSPLLFFVALGFGVVFTNLW